MVSVEPSLVIVEMLKTAVAPEAPHPGSTTPIVLDDAYAVAGSAAAGVMVTTPLAFVQL
jgi:hypothetical protein